MSTGYIKVGISRLVSCEPLECVTGGYVQANAKWGILEVSSFGVLLATAYPGAVFVCCNQC